MEEVHDWRCVSQHYTQTLIEKACTGELVSSFAPTLLIAAHEHALSVANTLALVLATRTGAPLLTVLTPSLQLYDLAAHPYNAHPEAWTNGT